MPAVSSSPTLCLVDDSDPLVGELADVPAAPGGLLELIAQVPDPRKPRGKRHGLAAILGIALAATLTGARSFVAIAEWAADTARRCWRRWASPAQCRVNRRSGAVCSVWPLTTWTR